MKNLNNSFQKTELFYRQVISNDNLLEDFYRNNSKLKNSILIGHHFKNFNGEINHQINFNLMPFLLCQEDNNYWALMSNRIDRIIEKIAEAFFSGDAKVQNYFSQFKIYIPYFKKVSNRWHSLSRYDVMVNQEGTAKFTEFNTSSPGGMLIFDLVNKHTREYLIRQHINEKFLLSPLEQKDSFVNYLISLEKKNNIHPETIAFLYDSHRVQLELYEMKDLVEGSGRKAIVASIDELTYRNGSLFINKEKISMIYNNFFLAGENLSLRQPGPWELNQETFLSNHPYSAFFRGIQNNACLLVNGFAAMTITENKRIFCFMHHPKFQYLFKPDERDFIKRHIPYSYDIDDSFFHNSPAMKRVIENKNNLVLKISQSALGIGVFMGSDLNEIDWEQLILNNIDKAILQTRVYGKKVPAILSEDKIHTDNTNIVFSIYNYSGEYYGLLGRISEGSITNYSRGMMQPILWIR